MADYVRFEFYIPRVYTVYETIAGEAKPRERKVSLSAATLQEFVDATLGRYRGITQANPHAAALYKGWWRPDEGGIPFSVDYLTYLFGLIKIDQSDEALGFFQEWKKRLEQSLHQDVILVVYHPVQTIGEFI